MGPFCVLFLNDEFYMLLIVPCKCLEKYNKKFQFVAQQKDEGLFITCGIQALKLSKTDQNSLPLLLVTVMSFFFSHYGTSDHRRTCYSLPWHLFNINLMSPSVYSFYIQPSFVFALL